MKEYTYVNKKYLGVIEGKVEPSTQYLWLNDGVLKRFKDGGWEALNGNNNLFENIKWKNLKYKRDNNQLAPGTFYRITDYITTTSQENTASAGHSFDVIVLALSENTLSEEAYAIQSDRDTERYFANCNLAAWKLWYCLDNDTTRFAWADTDNGTGVIYRMIDEWGNDCPYDFKNITFTRYELIAPEEYKAVDIFGIWCEQLSKNIRAMFVEGVASYKWSGIELGDRYWEDDGNSIYSQSTAERKQFYTFSDITNYETSDYTIDASLSSNCYNNKMGVYKEDDVMKLPNNVFFGEHCHNNKLGENCYFNSFGNEFWRNSFGDNCYSNSFGNRCSSNSFGDNCYINNFGDACDWNSFSDACGCNSMGSSCSNTKLGTDTGYNSFGTYCDGNKFEPNCLANSLGHNCHYNNLGNGSSYNNFAESCIANSLGYSCAYNRLGRNYQYNTFGEDVGYVQLANNEQGGYDDCVQNYRVSNGIQGTHEEPIVLHVERNRNYETTIAINSDGKMVQFCVADLI